MVDRKGKDILDGAQFTRGDNEISTGLDDLPNAAHFRRMRSGLGLRMALIAPILRKV
jgi:aspartate carbamoyltransferase catalytic subunit